MMSQLKTLITKASETMAKTKTTKQYIQYYIDAGVTDERMPEWHYKQIMEEAWRSLSPEAFKTLLARIKLEKAKQAKQAKQLTSKA
jgi:hypothetical protein